MPKVTQTRSLVVDDALSALDRINTSIVESEDIATMMPRVLDDFLDIFQCDRAWVMFPCDPNVEELVVHSERCRP
jgi:hypothetical protein